MKTAIVTDTNSGISPQEAENLGIRILPMPVIIDGKTHYEGIDLEEKEFYSYLSGGHDVSTSQPSPGDTMDLWDDLLSSGYDEIVHIPMSSGLSTTCETALALAADYDGKVAVVDNHRISVTLRIAVMEALEMVKAGIPAAEIKKDLEARAYDSIIYLAVDDLTYLKRGGRVTPATAALGAVLNIKPLLQTDGQSFDAVAKCRGMKKCKAKMVEALRGDYENRFGHPDISRIRIGAAGAALTPEQAEEWRQELIAAFPGVEVYYDSLSLSVGTHTGPGSFGCGISILKA